MQAVLIKEYQLRVVHYCAMVVFMLIILAINAHPCQEEQRLPVTEYKIGSKDLLEIKVFELPELNQTVRVSEDGSISLALLGKVDVTGLTAQELEKKLATILDGKYTKAAHVTVFIKEYQKVSILGAVARPGNYELVGPTTLLQIISQAGGLTGQTTDELYILRKGKDGQREQIKVNLQDLIVKGNQALNMDLQPNDVVSIPVDQMLTIYVYGEVKNPGALQYRQSKQISLLQAIAQAGGPTEWAKKSRVIIKRKEKATGKEIKFTVNLDNMIKGKTSDLLLEEGDIVIIP